jgi:hypothetical protein
VIPAVAIGVWVTVSKVTLIILIFKLNLKCKGVVETPALLFHTVLVIANTLAISLPPQIVDVSVLSRVKKGPLALVVRTLGLHEIDEVKFICLIPSSVLYTEIVPLSVSTGAIVILKNQVIL